MSKLNQSLKKELLRATEPKNLSLLAFGGVVEDLPDFNVDTECEAPEGLNDTGYQYALVNFFTDDKTIEPNKFLSRNYNFIETHGYIRISVGIGFRQRKGNDISIDLPSLTLHHAVLFQERKFTTTGVLDRDANKDLMYAIAKQFQSPKFRSDALNIIGMGVTNEIENSIPF